MSSQRFRCGEFIITLSSRGSFLRFWCGYRSHTARGRRAVQQCVPGDARYIRRLGVYTVCGVGDNPLCTHQVGVSSDAPNSR